MGNRMIALMSGKKSWRPWLNRPLPNHNTTKPEKTTMGYCCTNKTPLHTEESGKLYVDFLHSQMYIIDWVFGLGYQLDEKKLTRDLRPLHVGTHWLNPVLLALLTSDLSHESHNAPLLYHTMHHFVTEMCTFLLRNGALWDIFLWIMGFVRWEELPAKRRLVPAPRCRRLQYGGWLRHKEPQSTPHSTLTDQSTCLAICNWQYR